MDKKQQFDTPEDLVNYWYMTRCHKHLSREELDSLAQMVETVFKHTRLQFAGKSVHNGN